MLELCSCVSLARQLPHFSARWWLLLEQILLGQVLFFPIDLCTVFCRNGSQLISNLRTLSLGGSVWWCTCVSVVERLKLICWIDCLWWSLLFCMHLGVSHWVCPRLCTFCSRMVCHFVTDSHKVMTAHMIVTLLSNCCCRDFYAIS
jgi:hypothetical protein